MTKTERADLYRKLAECSEMIYQNTKRQGVPDRLVRDRLERLGILRKELFPHVIGDVRYSDLQVLSSNAGFFVGRTCWVEEDGRPGYRDMGSRESGYFPTRDQAQFALDCGFEVRDCPENEHAYSRGLPRPNTVG